MRRLVRAIVDFIVGDDVWIAVAVATLLAVAAALEHFEAGAWWVLPVGIPAALWISLGRALKASR